MDIEFAVKTIEIDERLQDKIKEMLAEGWQLVSGTKPVAVYHVQRMKQMPQVQSLMGAAGAGGIKVDEDQIFILRNGKLLKPGEENLPENLPPKT
jgi:hypothetical protein